MIQLLALTLTSFVADTTELDHAIALLDQLDRTVISAEYSNAPVRAVIDDLNSKLPVQLWPDWLVLDRLGVDPDDRVSLRLNNMRAGAAIAALTLALGDELERPVIDVNAGQLVLTRVTATAYMRQTAAYDVRDLLANQALVERLRKESPPVTEVEPKADDDEEMHQPLPAAPVPMQNLRAPTPGEQLLWLILDHVDPEAWMNFGGDRALVTELDGVLLVSATPATHRRFRDSLRMLRVANSPAISLEIAIVDIPRARYESATRQHSAGSGALTATLLNDSSGVVLWKAGSPMTITEPLRVESSAGDAAIALAIDSQLDSATGLLRLTLDASSSQAGDRRVVKTTVTLTSDQHSTLMELPAAKPGPNLRLLVVTVQRR